MPFPSLPAGAVPSFYDRAIGGVMGGTVTPATARLIQIDPLANGIFEEYPDSPQIEFAEQGTIRHAFRMEYNMALIYASGLKRGTILVDNQAQYSRVLSTSVNSTRGNMADLVVVAESLMTADVPPDEFSIEPIEFNPNITKHPRYFIFDATNPTPFVILTPLDIWLVTSSIGASNYFTRQDLKNLIAQIPNPSDPDTSQTSSAKRKAAAQELAQKLTLGIEAPYIPAFRVTWSQYFFYGASFAGSSNVNPNLNPGGFVQDPTTIIPPDFWSWDGSGTAVSNILLPESLGGAMDTTLSPAFYELGISWLRESDSIYYQRTWFRLTSTWIGGPIGHWDADIYSAEPSPYLP